MDHVFLSFGSGKSAIPPAVRDTMVAAAADAVTFGRGGIMIDDDNVTRLSPADLDRLAIELHRENDPDFDIPELAPGLGAYAPDPDRDYDRGHDAGYQAGWLDCEARDTRARVHVLDFAIVCAAILLVVLVVVVSGQP